MLCASRPAATPVAKIWLAALAIVAAVAVAYAGSFQGPFVFDDVESIAENPTVRNFISAFSPPSDGSTVSGRPLLNATFALNFAVSGTQVWSYHAVNVGIHILAALTLFGLVRRTCEGLWRAGGAPRPGAAAVPDPLFFACFVALIWAVHPLQTESVTYVAQRAESLMGLFYLLTLYGFVRAAQNPLIHSPSASAGEPESPTSDCLRAGPGRRGIHPTGAASGYWLGFSCSACLFGMATKEVMATAPLVVLLFDRIFAAGSLRGAWKLRRTYYVALASTWLLQGALVFSSHGRGGTAGFGSGAPWGTYALAQFRAIVLYLRLSVWPSPLIFDYGTRIAGSSIETVVAAALVTSLAAASVFLFLCRRPLGFLGVTCLGILMPSSSVIPVATEVMAEHRMYLSLAAIVAALVWGVWALARALGSAFGLARRTVAMAAAGTCVAAALALGTGTARRNDVYRSPLTLWSDTVRKLPGNPGARNNLGIELTRMDDLAGAEAQYRAALAIQPGLPEVRNNLGNVLAKQGALSAAVDQFQESLRYRPRDEATRENLGVALLRLGRIEDARRQFEEILRINPRSPQGHFELGIVLSRMGRPEQAAAEYREAVRLKPEHAQAWYNLGGLLVRQGQLSAAAEAYASAVRFKPDFADARVNYGNTLAQLGRTPEAVGQLRAAIQLQPNAADLHFDLGEIFRAARQWAAAKSEFEETLRLDPHFQQARTSLDAIEGGRPTGFRAGP